MVGFLAEDPWEKIFFGRLEEVQEVVLESLLLGIWKLKLVRIPPVDIRVFDKWQYICDKVDENLLVKVTMMATNPDEEGRRSVTIKYQDLFLGVASRVIRIMRRKFPELGVSTSDCREMRWIDLVVYMGGYSDGTSIDILLEARSYFRAYFKAKSDFVRKPISASAITEIWKRLKQDNGALIFTPYGGMMNNIAESTIPFPHRKGNVYMIQYSSVWQDGKKSDKMHMKWVIDMYKFMEPYVSKNPRIAYANYRDFDLGVNEKGNTSFKKAGAWGYKYFKGKFKKLVHIKTKIDPGNFFQHEQSIPVVH